MTYDEFAKKHNIKLTVTRIPFRIDMTDDEKWSDTAKHFAFCLTITEGKRFNKQMKGHFSQGSLIKGVPQRKDILNSLSLDTQGIEGTSFEMWAQDYGYDTDSRKAYATYQACLKESEQLKELLGSEGLEELHQIKSL